MAKKCNYIDDETHVSVAATKALDAGSCTLTATINSASRSHDLTIGKTTLDGRRLGRAWRTRNERRRQWRHDRVKSCHAMQGEVGRSGKNYKQVVNGTFQVEERRSGSGERLKSGGPCRTSHCSGSSLRQTTSPGTHAGQGWAFKRKERSHPRMQVNDILDIREQRPLDPKPLAGHCPVRG